MDSRVVVGITGATGQIYGIRALELLRETDFESHLILSSGAEITLAQEADYSTENVRALADVVHSVKNIGAPVASGSFRTNGMLIAPCSMKTLSGIANGYADNLIARGADVVLKERKPLVLMPREKPFNRIHLENMLAVTDAGGVIMPPFPSFYQGTLDIDEMITRTVARALYFLDVEVEIDEWEGLSVSALDR